MADKKQEKQNDDFKYLVRINNVDLDGKKPVGLAIKKIKGIGFMFANAICNVSGISKNQKTGDLSDAEIKKLEETIKDSSKFPVWMLNKRKDYETGEDIHATSHDLKYQQENDVKLLRKIKSYKGIRHSFGLTVRGQRTRSNFRKNKGKVQGLGKRKGASRK